MGCGEWKFVQMFQVTWPCPYMVKNYKIFFFRTKRPMTLKLGIQHQVLEHYQCFHMMTLGWPKPFLWQGQICFRVLLHGWKLIQHWVLMYFQVCSNSAYPQHSGKWYRTNDPLVYFWCRCLWVQHQMNCLMTKPTKWHVHPDVHTVLLLIIPVWSLFYRKPVQCHPPSLISLHCLHEESLGPYLPIKRTAKILIRLGGCPGWSESSLGAQSFCWFTS